MQRPRPPPRLSNREIVLMAVVAGLGLQLMWMAVLTEQPAPEPRPARGLGRLAALGGLGGGAAAEEAQARRADAQLDAEVWARPPPQAVALGASPLRLLLSPQELQALGPLCGRGWLHALQTGFHARGLAQSVFVGTGDPPLMWLRDSAVLLGALLPRVASAPALRLLVEGGIRAQAFYISQDPYASAFLPHWRHPGALAPAELARGGGGWVAVRRYGADSGAYFLHLLWNYYRTAGLYLPEALLAEPLVFEAAQLVVRTWAAEQHHGALSPYRYPGLAEGGRGRVVAYTGMTWRAFRPSGAPAAFGYSIPTNAYITGALQRALRLNARVWRSGEFEAAATKLLGDIQQGIQQHALVQVSEGKRVYAYEVDGLGGQLLDFDDPTPPSLVGLPLLGMRGYSKEAYRATRSRILSAQHNSYYYEGSSLQGLGSPHSPPRFVSALGLAVEALSAGAPTAQAAALRRLLGMQCGAAAGGGGGLLGGAAHADDPHNCSRRAQEWANMLAGAAVEHLVGLDCWAAAEEAAKDLQQQLDTGRGGSAAASDSVTTHQGLAAWVHYDGEPVPKPGEK